MKKGKCRVTALLLALMALTMVFAGCGSGEEKQPEKPTAEKPAATEAAKETETPGASTETPAQPTDPGKEEEGHTVLYQLADTKYDWQMMSYMIYTRSGKLIIIDGGYDHNGADLVALAKKLTGQAVPVVDAWLMTHCHEDHVNAFSALVSGGRNELDIKKVYYNFPSETYIKKYAEETWKATWKSFDAAIQTFDKSKVQIVKQGDRFTIDNVQFEVLLTPDESITSNVMNESSVVYRMTAEGQRVLFLGDLSTLSGNRFYAACGGDYTCDIVQMSHHGSYGLLRNFYKKMKAKACLWPAPKWLFENDGGSGYNTGNYETVQIYEYMTKNCGVKTHFVAKDGLQEIVLPLKFD